MNSAPATEAAGLELAPLLFTKAETPVYAILDGASVPDLVKNLYQFEPDYCCLYRGELAPDMASVAPYLVRLEAKDQFSELVLREGWGAHWGTFIISPASLRALRDHFREFHTVELPDQRSVLFRYYDPRVLRSFLPVCNADELTLFFGPVQAFVVEGDTAESGMKFSLAAKVLKSDSFQLKKAS